ELREVRVTVKPESGLRIAEIKSFSKPVKIRVLEQAEHSATFAVSLDPAIPVGEFRDRIVVNLRGEKEMSVNVPVFAFIEGSLKLNPGTLSFGIIEGNEPIERSVKLDNLGAQPVQITSVTSSDPAVTAEHTVIKEGEK